MKRTTLLNAPLSGAIARLGHTDYLLIADAGLPIPVEPERIDLALVAGVPTVMHIHLLVAPQIPAPLRRGKS